jgi:SAM-dependent methyltransferase
LEPEEYEVLSNVEGRHWWHVGMRKLSAACLDSAGPRPAARVLDAGCGTGGNAECLARYGRVWGIDISPLAIRLAAARFPGRTIQGSVEELPFAPESFDVVTSFEVLYHQRVGDEVRALSESARVLRPGGKLLIRLPAFPWLVRHHDRRVHTRRRYRLGEVSGMLERSGFRVLRATYVNALLLPAVILSVLAERIFPAFGRDGSQLRLPNRFVNRLLAIPLALETAWVRRGGTFPAGLSILCLGEKRD